MISIFFFTFFTILIVIGYGLALNFLLKLKKIELFDLFFLGIFLLTILSLSVNFFFSIKSFHLLIQFFGLIIVLYSIFIKRFNINSLKIILVLSIFVCILLFLSRNVVDFPMYHLPYIATIFYEKISFGLSNIHFRFAHTSLLQNISSFFYFALLDTESFSILPACLVVFVIYHFYKKIKYERNSYFISLSFLILVFILLKSYRFNDYGNDLPAHVLAFVVFYNFLEFLFKNNQNNFLLYNKLILFNILILLLAGFKLSYVFMAILPIIIIYKLKSYVLKFFNIKIFFLNLIFLLIFFSKNFILSGCLIYPVEQTCFKNVNWYPKETYHHANLENRKFEIKYRSRGYFDYLKSDIATKNQPLSKIDYTSSYNWVNYWLLNHFSKEILKNIFIFSFVVFFIYIMVYLKYRKFKIKTSYNFFLDNKFSILLTSFILFFFLVSWFHSAPSYRYGAFYVIMPLIFFFSIISTSFDNNLKKYYRLLIIILISIISIWNILRISNHFSLNNLIYSNNNYYMKNIIYKIHNSELKINTPINNNEVCWFSKNPCTHFTEAIYQIKISKHLNYKFYNLKN